MPTLSARPRIFATPARLARWRAYAALPTLRWQKCQKAATAALVNGTLFNDGPALTLAYLMTGNVQYAQKAIALLAAYVTSPGLAGLQSDSGYNFRYLASVALVYDGCHDQLTPAQVQQCSAWLMDACDWVWPETTPTRKSGWAIADPADNYFQGFLVGAWCAALAVAGDDPVVRLVDGTQGTRSAYHLALVRQVKYPQLVRPFLLGWAQGGVWPEGTGYDSTRSLALALDAHLCATGEDLFEDTPFLEASLLWRIHGTCPGLVDGFPLGDQPRASIDPLSDYDRDRALEVYVGIANGTLQGEAQFWLNSILQEQWTFTEGWEFLFGLENTDCPPVDYRTLQPLGYTAPNTVTVRRSDWSGTATYFGIQLGPLSESHQTADAAGLYLWKGGWLLAPAKVWSQSGIVQATQYGNNWVFPSASATIGASAGYYGQYGGSTAPYAPAGCTTLWCDHEPGYSSVAVQVWPAYVYNRPHGGTPTLNDYRRAVVYLPSVDSFLVLDRVATASPTQQGLFALHAKAAWSINGPSYSVSNGPYTLAGQALGPAPASITNTPLPLGPNNAVSSNRLDVLYPAAQGPQWYCHVLQILPAGSSPRPATIVEQTADHITVAVGTTTVVLPTTDNPIPLPLRIPTMAIEIVAGPLAIQPGQKVYYRVDGGPLQTVPAASISPAGIVDLAGLAPQGMVQISPNLQPSINIDDPATWAPLLGYDPAFAATVPGKPWGSVDAFVAAAEALVKANESKVTT